MADTGGGGGGRNFQHVSKYEFKLSKYELKLSKYEFKLSNLKGRGMVGNSKEGLERKMEKTEGWEDL